MISERELTRLFCHYIEDYMDCKVLAREIAVLHGRIDVLAWQRGGGDSLVIFELKVNRMGTKDVTQVLKYRADIALACRLAGQDFFTRNADGPFLRMILVTLGSEPEVYAVCEAAGAESWTWHLEDGDFWVQPEDMPRLGNYEGHAEFRLRKVTALIESELRYFKERESVERLSELFDKAVVIGNAQE